MVRQSVFIISILAGMATEAEAQERQWSFDMTDSEAYLVFGVPETDDVGISFWCTFGTAKIKIFVPEGGTDIKPNEVANFTMTVADKPYIVSAKSAVNELSVGVSLEGELETTAPLFTALKEANRLQVTAGNHTTTYPLDSAEFNNLITICSAK